MRLWHKDLISVLPRQQLLGQWRECCSIAKNIAKKGSPNHLLVNRIMEYPLSHFYIYCEEVYGEMRRRGYKGDWSKFSKWVFWRRAELPDHDELFEGWHNDRYLLQCLYNLQEKFDCEGIGLIEWEKIEAFIMEHERRRYMKEYTQKLIDDLDQGKIKLR